MTAVSQGFPRCTTNQILGENAAGSQSQPAVPVPAAPAGSSPAAAQGVGYPAALLPVTSAQELRFTAGEPRADQESRIGILWLSALLHFTAYMLVNCFAL